MLLTSLASWFTLSLTSILLLHANPLEPAKASIPASRPATVGAATRGGEVRAFGVVQPTESVEVGAQVSGAIRKLGADFNTVVKQGTVLAQLDTTFFEIRLERAKADLQRAEASRQLAAAKATLAERNLERARKLVQNKAIDTAEVEILKAQHDVELAVVVLEEAEVTKCKTAVRHAEYDLDYCTIRSPIDGVIVERRCELGQNASASFQSPALFVIAKDLKKLHVAAAVMEKDIGRITSGQTARITVDAFPGEAFSGRVAQIRGKPTAEKGQASMFTVIIEVDNSTQKLRPYLRAEVVIEVGERP